MQNTSSTLSRRKVTAGIAWSVPAVAAVAAAPFAAASPTGCAAAVPGDVIKYPGNVKVDGIKQAYGFEITITNTSTIAVYVNPGSVTIDFDKKKGVPGEARLYTADPCAGGVRLAAMDDALLLQPGESKTYFYVANETGDSANEGGCIHAALGLSLPTDSPEGSDLCEDGTVKVKQCFTETPPTAKC